MVPQLAAAFGCGLAAGILAHRYYLRALARISLKIRRAQRGR